MKQTDPNYLPLRHEAEAQLTHAPKLKPHPTEELLHELQVHQIELEMQNEQLRSAQLALEKSRDHYVDLYEFAPVGYLTLTGKGMISDVNLTASVLLKVERNRLLHKRFATFVAPECRDRWNRLFVRVLQHAGSQNFELVLENGDGESLQAYLDCIHLVTDGEQSAVRIALTDLTERKQVERKLRNLAAHTQTVREEEKASFAREIHDDLGGTLTALKMEAYWLAEELSAHEEATPLLKHVELMVRLADDATNTMRRIITGMRPTMLDDLGLSAAIEWHATKFCERTGIECQVNCIMDEDCETSLDQAQSINLFRIFQEALNNVAKHSRASRIAVEFCHGNEEVVLSVKDNGCGMLENHVVTPGGTVQIHR